jgi:hypothetical protein
VGRELRRRPAPATARPNAGRERQLGDWSSHDRRFWLYADADVARWLRSLARSVVGPLTVWDVHWSASRATNCRSDRGVSAVSIHVCAKMPSEKEERPRKDTTRRLAATGLLVRRRRRGAELRSVGHELGGRARLGGDFYEVLTWKLYAEFENPPSKTITHWAETENTYSDSDEEITVVTV